jgi:hypothetical protein
MAGVVSHSTGEVSPPQMAIADTRATGTQTPLAKPAGFFASLFASKSSAPETKTVEAKPAEKKSGGAIDRVAKLVGLRNSDAKPAPADAAKPGAAAKPAQAAANGAIRPKPADAAQVKTAEAQSPQPATAGQASQSPWPAVPAPQRAPAPAPAPANNGGISGAAPVVPSGFDNRWSAFR